MYESINGDVWTDLWSILEAELRGLWIGPKGGEDNRKREESRMTSKLLA